MNLLDTVKKDPFVLYYVKPDEITEEVAAGAVSTNPKVVKYLPREAFGEVFYQKIFTEYNLDIRSLPENFVTEEVCIKAVMLQPKLLNEIPLEKRSGEVCAIAINRGEGSLLEFVPEDLKSRELCLEAVKKDGWAIEFVPEACKDAGMCHEALKNCAQGFRADDWDGPVTRIDAFIPLRYRDENGLPLSSNQMYAVDKQLQNGQVDVQL